MGYFTQGYMKYQFSKIYIIMHIGTLSSYQVKEYLINMPMLYHFVHIQTIPFKIPDYDDSTKIFPQETKIPKGNPASFKCNLKGFVKWKYRGQFLADSNTFLDKGHILIFESVELQDAGKYYCTNNYTLKEYMAVLIVLGTQLRKE